MVFAWNRAAKLKKPILRRAGAIGYPTPQTFRELTLPIS
jgi:hypothetical protein